MDNPPRAGKDHRINQDRFFHVMGQGWYVLTREGVDGPYMDKHQVNDRIQKYTQPEQAKADAETSNDEPAPWEDFFLR
jgi:hypothetical protein